MSRLNLETEVSGSVWKIQVEVGSTVSSGDELVIVESMKMEIPVCSPSAGQVVELLVKEGDSIVEGQAIIVIETP